MRLSYESKQMNNEKIISIREINYPNEIDENSSGYVVTTTDQEIHLFIDNRHKCCENWGYFWCNDNVSDFVGARLYDVKVTDEIDGEIITQKLANEVSGNYEGLLMFVTLETDRGDLQFVAYNKHDGYYGHSAKVECKQIHYETTL